MRTTSQRKAPKRAPRVISEEHLREAAALRKRWEETADRRAAAGVGNQAEFGDRFDIGNQSAVGGFLHGRTPLILKAARGFALGLKCQVSDFSPRLAKQMQEMAEMVSGESEWLGSAAVSLSEHALSLATRFDALPTPKRKQAYALIANTLEVLWHASSATCRSCMLGRFCKPCASSADQ